MQIKNMALRLRSTPALPWEMIVHCPSGSLTLKLQHFPVENAPAHYVSLRFVPAHILHAVQHPAALWRFEWEATLCAELLAHIERDRGEERKGNTPKCPPPSLLLSLSPPRSLSLRLTNARYHYCMKHPSGLQRFLGEMRLNQIKWSWIWIN